MTCKDNTIFKIAPIFTAKINQSAKTLNERRNYATF